ncbi:MAG: GyrI-like domain-containing protein [Acidimicrobiales bacterium]
MSTTATLTPQPAAIHAEVPMAELPSVIRAIPPSPPPSPPPDAPSWRPPFGFYPRMPGETVEVWLGFPIDAPIEATGEVQPFELPGGTAVIGEHVGPFDTLSETYEALAAWAADQGIASPVPCGETYVTDPSAEPDPSRWRTAVTWLTS